MRMKLVFDAATGKEALVEMTAEEEALHAADAAAAEQRAADEAKAAALPPPPGDTDRLRARVAELEDILIGKGLIDKTDAQAAAAAEVAAAPGIDPGDIKDPRAEGKQP